MPWWRWEGSGTDAPGSFQCITVWWDGRAPPAHTSGQIERMSRFSNWQRGSKALERAGGTGSQRRYQDKKSIWELEGEGCKAGMESWKAKIRMGKSWRRVRDGQPSLTSHCTAQDGFVSFSTSTPETCQAAVWQHKSNTAKQRPQLMAEGWLGTHPATEGAFEKCKICWFSSQGCSKLSPATNYHLSCGFMGQYSQFRKYLVSVSTVALSLRASQNNSFECVWTEVSQPMSLTATEPWSCTGSLCIPLRAEALEMKAGILGHLQVQWL